MALTIPKDRSEFRIAIVCVLDEEFNAIAGTLDTDFQRDPYRKDYGRAEVDKNTYKNGRIGKHNVVIVKLPGTGKEPAASASSSIFISYSKIALALIVGVCAGSPTDEKGNEIILGDILISTHVFQHDHARILEGGMEPYETPEHTLGRAPKEIRSFVGIYSTDYERDNMEDQVATSIKDLLDKRFLQTYGYPGRDKDRLFRPEYHHLHPQRAGCLECEKNPASCQQAQAAQKVECTRLGCDITKLIGRERLQPSGNTQNRPLPLSTPLSSVSSPSPPPSPPPLPPPIPLIHFGKFASGDQVIRSSSYRESLMDRYNVIGFEMEAAGVWDNIPTVVIKGVCDYADSHKNKSFQRYAAVTAAACMKVLLERWHCVDTSLPSFDAVTMSESTRTEELPAILRWISKMSFTTTYQDHIDKMQPGSGKWILGDQEFCAWLKGERRTIWLRGMPGAGKTILISSIIQHLTTLKLDNVAIVFLYFQRKNKEHKSKALIASMLRQMVQQHFVISDEIWSSYKRHDLEDSELSDNDCKMLLQSEASRFDQVYIVIDALDEGDEQNVLELLGMLGILQNSNANVNVLVSSRHVNFFQDHLSDPVEIEVLAKDNDIKLFLEARLKVKPSLQKLISRYPDLKSAIVEAIIEKVKGMFLLAELLVELLESRKKRTKKDLLSLLKNMPSVLDKTYKELWQLVLEQDQSDVELAKMVFSIVTNAREQLTIQALRHIMWTWSTKDHESIDEDDLMEENQFLPVCLGLIQSNKDIVSFIHYTAETFFPGHLLSYLPDAEINMAVACINYLSLPHFGVRECTVEAAEEDGAKFAFLSYAARNWGYHAKKSPQDRIGDTVRKFLDLDRNLNYSASFLVWCNRDRAARTMLGNHNLPYRVIHLHLMAYFGLDWAILELLGSKVNINSKDSLGWDALRWAAHGRQCQTVALLAENQSTIDQKDHNSMTTLHWALGESQTFVKISGLKIYDCSFQIYETYLTNDLQNPRGNASEFLMLNTSNEIVTILIENTDDIDAKNSSGRSALSLAAQNQQWGFVKHLLRRRADVDSIDNQGMTPLLWALQFSRTYREYSDIEIHGDSQVQLGDFIVMDPTIQMNNTQTNIPTGQRENDIISLIGSKVNLKDFNGRSALSLAAEKGLGAVVRSLLDKGADVDSVDVEGKTPLMWALIRSTTTSYRVNRVKVFDTAIVFIGTILESYSRSVEDFGSKIHLFFDDSRMEIINCFVKMSMNLGQRDLYESTAYDLAVRQGLSDVANAIQERLGMKMARDKMLESRPVHSSKALLWSHTSKDNSAYDQSLMIINDIVGPGAEKIAAFNGDNRYNLGIESHDQAVIISGNATIIRERSTSNLAVQKSSFVEKLFNMELSEAFKGCRVGLE